MQAVAFLQNQWFKDPERVRKIFAREPNDPERREQLLRRFLFRGCLTGKRLRECFGEDLCDLIVWEETSREIGDNASSKFPPDPGHMADVIRRHKPRVVIAFGLVALAGVEEAYKKLGKLRDVPILATSHPTARHATVMMDLRNTAELVREHLKGP